VKGKHALPTEKLPFIVVIFCLCLLVTEFKDFLHNSTLGGEATESKNKFYKSNIPELNSKQIILKFIPNIIILSHLSVGLTLNVSFEDFVLVTSFPLLLGFSSWLFLSKFCVKFLCALLVIHVRTTSSRFHTHYFPRHYRPEQILSEGPCPY
jgi:hypothetical protein